jgi:riboflavin synthase
MFTGIIQAVGHISALESRGDDRRLRVAAGGLDLADVSIGNSIAVSGICLTVVDLPGDGFWADVSGETLQRTVIGALRPGDRINLETALTLDTRLGGHLVSGHVDGVGVVETRDEDGRSARFTIRAPDELARYIAEKGSVCVDGVSLTVNAVSGARFGLNIVPHTLRETTFDEYRPGRRVNIEVDIIARYLERLLLGERAAVAGTAGITLEKLAQYGFLKAGK